MPPKTKQLLDDLRKWCDEGRGRRVEIAKVLGTSRQAVTHWFGGRQQPSAEQALTILEFLQKQQKRRSKTKAL